MKKLFFAVFLLLGLKGYTQHSCAHSKGNANDLVFTLSEAEMAKLNQYNLTYYKINMEVKTNSKFIRAQVYLEAKTLATLKEFTLQLHSDLLVDSVWFNQKNTGFARVGNFLNMETDADSLLPNTGFNATIFYHGTPPATTDGAISGAGFSNDAAKQVTWTLSQPYSAFEWFPCKQLNTDKIDSLDFWISTDSVNKAGSNGLLKNVVPLPNGLVRYEWSTKYPIAYYLISLAVAPYQEYISYAHPAGSDSILVQDYLYKNASDNVKNSVAYTPALIELFSRKFGLYPFAKEKYGHSQAPISGGMEHQTMTSIGAFNFDIVAHELGHQWFGDYVTCNAYSEIWLNEGFATFTELVALENMMPSQKQYWVSSNMNQAKQAPSTVFVNDSNDVRVLFDGNSSYAKGGVVLYMLRHLVNNDSLFFLGIRNYLQTYAYGSARTPDFKRVMEETTGLNLATFFDQWIYKSGYPVLSGKWNQMGQNVLLRIEQTPLNGNTVFNFPLEVLLKFSSGDTLIKLSLDAGNKMVSIPVGGRTIQSIRFDPNVKLLRDLFSIAYDPTFNAVQDNSPEFHQVLIYPNPSQNQLQVSNAMGADYSVYTLSGQKLFENTLQSTLEPINIEALPAGIYLLQLRRNEHITTLRFAKQ